DGVVLGSDTRATVGSLVADKNCLKIHYLAPNMYCCGAGTAADTEQVCSMVASQLKLHRLATDRVVPVIVAENLTSQHLFREFWKHHCLPQANRNCVGRGYQENPHFCLEEALAGVRCRM
ncbi:Proteasome subunit beta type-7-A, partial [Araneus ventricosus]